MRKLLFILSLVLVFLAFVTNIQAASSSSFVTIVNPVRGSDFWDLKEERPEDAVAGEAKVLREFGIPATWLIRFDALTDAKITDIIESFPVTDEKGIFLEVTPSWAQAAGVRYRNAGAWHFAGNVFLTGYTQSEREKLVDVAFVKFKDIFGFYPKSVGAWYIDSYSLKYIQEKYGISGALIVTDQYTTDNYQIWGQYWSTPYYPSKQNTLRPAQSSGDKLPVVVMQWATRDPVRSYGKFVEDSTYSVQPNDYLDYHHLNTDYFSKLIDLYTTQELNQFGQVVVGLENSYSWKKYQGEYEKQMRSLDSKRKENQVSLVSMENFSAWYDRKFPELSPNQIIVAQDPLGEDQMSVWFMNPYYRAGWFYDKNGSAIRDTRQYIEGEKEPCYEKPCTELNFATFATRVLDDVTYGKRLNLDGGKIKDVVVKKGDRGYVLEYKNEAGRNRTIEFMPRDIAIDGKADSIDSFILRTINSTDGESQSRATVQQDKNQLVRPMSEFIFQLVKFIFLVPFIFIIPGFLIVRSIGKQSFALNIFLSLTVGMVDLTLLSYIAGYLNIPWLAITYIGLSSVFFFSKRVYLEIHPRELSLLFNKKLIFLEVLVVAGVIFQSLAMIRSGWIYDYGMGFWGPIGHDGIWHQALIAQLVNNIPPPNPVFAGETLKNYHYFFDLLVAVTYRLTQIPVLDLLYRFYPALLSLLLGVGTYQLVSRFTKSKIAAFISLYFVYFGGSFGWVVTYLKEKTLSGESAFWVNQPVSMNLNPPFAISLVIVIAIVLVLRIFREKRSLSGAILLTLMAGSLMEFKVYGGVIVLGGLLSIAVYEALFRKDFTYLKIFIASILLAMGVFLPQSRGAGELLVWSPFWFIHSMVDFPDRVGWVKLSMGRLAYIERGEWFKFISAEVLALAIFIVGNLGTRSVVLFSAAVFIKKRLWKMPEYLFLLVISIVSFFIPIAFIQKGNPWNTIQFMYYLLYFVALFTGVTVVSVFWKLPKYPRVGLVILILILTPISAWATFRSYLYPVPPSRLSGAELGALNFLRSLPDGAVLTYPYNKELRSRFTSPFPLFAYETTAYVAAFSNKATFVEDEIQQEILQTDYRKRITAAKDFFNDGNIAVLRENGGVRYIYLLKSMGVNLNEEKTGIKKIFENSEVLIYEVKS